MALLPILEFPDPRLRTRAQPVAAGGRSAAQARSTTCSRPCTPRPGIGLAATQVNVHKRAAGHRHQREARRAAGADQSRRSSRASGIEETEEGCLSVPGIYDKVDARRADPRAGAGPRRQAVRIRRRRAARRVHPARDRSSRRQAVRRLPVRAQAHAHPQEAREGAQGRAAPVHAPARSRAAEDAASDERLACAIVFAGTPEFAVPALEALLRSRASRRRGLHAAGSAGGPRPAARGERGQAVRAAARLAGRAAGDAARPRRSRAPAQLVAPI